MCKEKPSIWLLQETFVTSFLNYLLSALPQIKSLHLENTKPVLAHSLPLLHAELLELFLYSLAHLPQKLAAPKKDLLLLP